MQTEFTKRINDLESRGWRQTKVGMTNDKYSFLWYQIDTDKISNEDWQKFLKEIDKH